MNIYEKMNEARSRFREEGFNKNGKNSFSNYSYFKLKDILNLTTRICRDLKIFCMVSFGQTDAVMTVIDCEKPDDRIEFATPMSRAALKGCHEVQNLGAVETYLRRYLYMTAFEIEECEPAEDLDSGAVQSEESDGQKDAPAHPTDPEPRGAVDEVLDFINQYHDALKSTRTRDGSSDVLSVLDAMVQARDERGCAAWIPWLRQLFKSQQH